MSTFILFGRYTTEALKGISAERSEKARRLINKYGGKITAAYATLGKVDLVLVVQLPSIEQAMKASVALHKMTGITFSTAPAVTVEEFDKLMASGA